MGTARPRDLLIGKSHTGPAGKVVNEQQPVLVLTDALARIKAFGTGAVVHDVFGSVECLRILLSFALLHDCKTVCSDP